MSARWSDGFTARLPKLPTVVFKNMSDVSKQPSNPAVQWEREKDGKRYVIVSAPQRGRPPLFILKMHEDGEKHQVCQIRMDAFETTELTLTKFSSLAMDFVDGKLALDTIYRARDDMLKSHVAGTNQRCKKRPATSKLEESSSTKLPRAAASSAGQ